MTAAILACTEQTLSFIRIYKCEIIYGNVSVMFRAFRGEIFTYSEMYIQMKCG